MKSPAPTPRLHRRVRHLRLACRDAAHARRAHTLLEDALRTASIDDAGRLIVVRRLDLGPMPLRASATAWSLRLEQRLACIPSALVSAHSPAAANASAVYFASAAEPWFLAAERAARAAPSPEWFWSLALPEWRHAQPASATLAQAFRTLATRADGLALTVHLGRRLAAQGTLPALLAVLTPELIAALPTTLRATEPSPLSEASRVSPAADPANAETPASSQPSAACVRHAQTWGREDPRTRWLAAVLAAPPASASGAQSSPTSLAALTIPSAEQINALVAALYFPPSRPSNAPIPSPAKPAAPATHPTVSPAPPAPRPETQPPVPAPAPDRRATAAGGLLFLLALFERAGLPTHLDTLPADSRVGCVSQLFHLALRHARIPAGDPLHELFPASAIRFARSPAWMLLAAARLARRRGISLRELIRRPALVSATPPNIDVFFRPGDADLRVRRAGLDIDPGWLPWLGLVVHFHYTRED